MRPFNSLLQQLTDYIYVTNLTNVRRQLSSISKMTRVLQAKPFLFEFELDVKKEVRQKSALTGLVPIMLVVACRLAVASKSHSVENQTESVRLNQTSSTGQLIDKSTSV